jgi:hypothetical protein
MILTTSHFTRDITNLLMRTGYDQDKTSRLIIIEKKASVM